ncbi:2-amino-4-hydroxy-6-hydroxymethyldihydropteridine diphosphokinase [Pseudooceanicola sp. HF7]|uniref:2-amino-4-hydroxy-6- hydroxymethyldihydropteridine diphosphokinase n=1 Tax=Pseudooceanicola sp. HF7 TaxID=2721560 RepID=UPI0034C696E6
MNLEVQDNRVTRSEGLAFMVAVGGNMFSEKESRGEFVRSVVASLEQRICPVERLSRLYSTPAFPAGSGPDYVNAALILRGEMSPDVMLEHLHEIEYLFGRERKKRWGPRRLDLDLIAAGDLVLPGAEEHRKWRELPLEEQLKKWPEELLLPHPRMQERAFVLVPLRDVAPEWKHPILGKTVTEMCDDLPTGALREVVPLPESACL